MLRSHASRTSFSAFNVFTVASVLVLASCARRHADSDAGHSRKPEAQSGGRVSTSPDEDAHVGAKAIAMLSPTPHAPGKPEEQISGVATFSQSSITVDLMISFRGCTSYTRYPVFIQEGSDCSDETLLGARWDSPRGEGITDLGCTGTTSIGRGFYSRSLKADKAWSIGNPARSNLLGHALVVYDPDTLQPIACGEIMRAPDAAPTSEAPIATTEASAAIAGLCLSQTFVRDNDQKCPDPVALAKCAREHCELDACLEEECADYVACLDQSDDPCSQAFQCEITDACAECQSHMHECVFGFCSEELACAAPVTPGGPCSKLEACCAMQGDEAESCLENVRVLERYSGDPSCYGAMHDWDVNSHLPVPCKFE
jgi:hypothetical protein